MRKGAQKPNYLENSFSFLWTLPPLHQHISDFALLIALGLHHIKLEDTQRMNLKSILLLALSYVLEKEQRVQSAQFKASVLI